MNTTPQKPEDMLDAYLDGTLDEAQRQGFGAQLKEDASLRREVEVQRQVDESLKRCHPMPQVEAILDRARNAASKPLRPQQGWLNQVGRIAAMILIGLTAALAIHWAITPKPATPYSNGYTLLGLEASYSQILDKGFEPLWRCETDEEFAKTFQDRLGQPLVLGALPTGVEALGLSYSPAISYNTIALLADVEGRRVIVFADHIQAVDGHKPELTGQGLNLFERRVGDLMLYEVTPLDSPALLSAMRIPENVVAPE